MRDTEKVQALQRQIERLQQQNRLSTSPNSMGMEVGAEVGAERGAGSWDQGDQEDLAVHDTVHDTVHEARASPSPSFATVWDRFLGQWVPSGWSELDSILPGAGFRRGALVEWFAQPKPASSDAMDEMAAGDETSSQPRASSAGKRLGSRGRSPCSSAAWGHGAGLLALRVAHELCRAGGTLVVLDQAEAFYPPTAAAWGLDLERLVWLRVKEAREAFWAMDQSLRCPAVRAVWCCLGDWDAHLDGRWFRRFQLAAEASGSVGLLVRSAAFRGRPSWAELQLEVAPVASDIQDDSLERMVQVKRIRCRGRGYPSERPRQLSSMSEKPAVNLSLEKWHEVTHESSLSHHPGF